MSAGDRAAADAIDFCLTSVRELDAVRDIAQICAISGAVALIHEAQAALIEFAALLAGEPCDMREPLSRLKSAPVARVWDPDA